MSKKQLLLMSSSKLHGYEFLAHSKNQIDELLKKNSVQTILFVPFAQNNYDDYTKRVAEPLTKWGYQVEGLHTKSNQIDAIKNAQAIFIGGGNTFVLLKSLYDNNLIKAIRDRVLVDGIPYISASAGTNVATRSIHTTNDMPVVYPPTFDALNLVNFNINPHYIEPDVNSTHKGETRDERINEFISYNNLPVLGLREGTSLCVNNDDIKLLGLQNARLFSPGEEPKEYPPNSDLSFLNSTD